MALDWEPTGAIQMGAGATTQASSQRIVGSTLHIPRGKKIPTTLIKKIIKMRIKKNSEHKKI